jgi:hypothetical protein
VRKFSDLEAAAAAEGKPTLSREWLLKDLTEEKVEKYKRENPGMELAKPRESRSPKGVEEAEGLLLLLRVWLRGPGSSYMALIIRILKAA